MLKIILHVVRLLDNMASPVSSGHCPSLQEIASDGGDIIRLCTSFRDHSDLNNRDRTRYEYNISGSLIINIIIC